MKIEDILVEFGSLPLQLDFLKHEVRSNKESYDERWNVLLDHFGVTYEMRAIEQTELDWQWVLLDLSDPSLFPKY